MNSLQRVLLTAILGALIVTSIGVAFGQSSATEPIRLLNQGALRSDPPDIAAPPANTAERYSPQWWVAEAEVEKWRQKYAAPVLVVFPAAIDRPAYTPSGDGAATSVAVLPMHGLWARREAIAAGQAKWALLSDAYAAMTAAPAAPAANGRTRSIRRSWAEVPAQLSEGNPHPAATAEYWEWINKRNAQFPRDVVVVSTTPGGQIVGWLTVEGGLGSFKGWLQKSGAYWFALDDTAEPIAAASSEGAELAAAKAALAKAREASAKAVEILTQP